MDIIAGISAAITAAKATGDYLEGNQDAQKKIIDLSLQLMDVHQKAMQLLKENSDLQARLRELEEQQRLDNAVYFQDEACWRKDKEGQEKGPYCHVCWEKDRRLLHLDYIPVEEEKGPNFNAYEILEREGHLRGRWYCTECREMFKDGENKEKPTPTDQEDSWISSRD